MAANNLSAIQKFNAYAQEVAGEITAQQVQLFNAATRGALVLTTGQNLGDYSDVADFSYISGLVRRRNAYADDAVSEVNLTNTVETSVKIAGGTPPVRVDPDYFARINQSPDAAGAAFGQQLAMDMLADKLNTAIKALVAALVQEATNVYDGTASTCTLNALNSGRAKLGDKAARIACWLAHSKAAFDIWGAALTNSNTLFSFGTVNVIHDGFNNPIIMTDSAGLSYTSGGTKYRTLGLVAGAAKIEDNTNETVVNISEINGYENIRRTRQAQWSYNMGLKGFTWDKTNGGPSPSDGAIAIGTNWDKTATSAKDIAGVVVNSQ